MNLAWITAVATALGPPGPAMAMAGPAVLTCSVATPWSRPLTFTPGVGLTPRQVSVSGYLRLTGCMSPDGSAAGLRSGWVAMKATAHASCTSARRVRGSAVITWFGADGRPIGTSKLRSRGDRLATQSPADTLLSGTVATGPLDGERVRGGITPATGLLTCATQGMRHLPGAGRITFG
ncbi:hypothetical protein [Nonomuraea basaltis]|uniref:hypothetical protein n=1 Tax=Nonomuraea basaltis TaxID=2495887 RepID=UPI00110C52F8|nr:hypothetical protein [Nonomuraea basaltis]TMR94823.1 hypothetical protein EJK15_31935 [Nonomuraea basaltis]